MGSSEAVDKTHPAGAGFKPAAPTRRVFLLDLAGTASC
jgi:hypothetical protein